jgi:hypothetical protein
MKRPFRTLRGKLAISVVSLAIVSVVAGVAVFSAFSSTVSTGASSFAAGSVTLTTNGTGAVLFNLPAMKPGDSASRCTLVTYSGTLPASVQFSGAVTGTLGPFLDTVVTRGTFPGAAPASNACTGFTADATGSQLFSNTLDQLPASSPLTDPATSWATGDSHVYEVTVTLPSNVATGAQGLIAGATLTWAASNQ